MHTVYCATNAVNGKQYIGITGGTVAARRGQHLKSARAGSPYRFHRAIAKHGPEAFGFETLIRCGLREQALALEAQLVADLKPAYNAAPGGGSGGMTGRKHSAETIAKMSAVKRGKPKSAAHRAAIGAANKIAWAEGRRSRHVSIETCNRRSASLKAYHAAKKAQ